MRGTLTFKEGLNKASGIIPACAGNTRCYSCPQASKWDHPRVCGEHRQPTASRRCKSGSSPRVRGTPTFQFVFGAERGIIPACAGNTSKTIRATRGWRDHPRVCGEHWECVAPFFCGRGSSPRVRGTRRHEIRVSTDPGIIPACAGNTVVPCRYIARRWDHPRVCGEHSNRFCWFYIFE